MPCATCAISIVPEARSLLPASAQDWAGEMGQRWLANLGRFESTIAPIGEALLLQAAYQPGERVVDIGCGGGATSLAIAERVAPNGEVLGIDVSPDLVAATIGRASRAGVSNAHFICADAGTVALDSAPYDRLCSRFGSMFFADPVTAFTNLRALVRPAGRIDLAVWASPGNNSWIAEPMQILSRYVDLPPPMPRAPGPFAFEDLDYLHEVLAAAGFQDVKVQPATGVLPVAGAGSSPADALGFMLEGQSFGTVVAQAPHALGKRVAADLSALFARRHRPGLGVLMDYKAWLVMARA